MGQARFATLLSLLPPGLTVVGIDEHSALVVDFETAECRVMGHGEVTLLKSGQEQHFAAGESFPATALGPFLVQEMSAGIPSAVWEEVLAAQASAQVAQAPVPPEVIALVEEREAARARRDWAAADGLRERIAAAGWSVLDTPEGPRLEPK
jgi:cysteinyl-tRNA synthetase